MTSTLFHLMLFKFSTISFRRATWSGATSRSLGCNELTRWATFNFLRDWGSCLLRISGRVLRDHHPLTKRTNRTMEPKTGLQKTRKSQLKKKKDRFQRTRGWRGEVCGSTMCGYFGLTGLLAQNKKEFRRRKKKRRDWGWGPTNGHGGTGCGTRWRRKSRRQSSRSDRWRRGCDSRTSPAREERAYPSCS